MAGAMNHEVPMSPVRVRVNPKKYKAYHGHRGRLGTAPHVPGDGQFWEVIWDGMKKKKAQTFHKDFIEIVRDGDN